MKLLAAVLLIAITALVTFASADWHFGVAQNPIKINGSITSDLTWTETSRKYVLTIPEIRSGGNAPIIDNIVNCYCIGFHEVFGDSTIQNKFIANNNNQIVFRYSDGAYYQGVKIHSKIQNNNPIAISTRYFPFISTLTVINTNVQTTISRNNFENSPNCNLFLGSKHGVDAANNWLKTNEMQLITQTIDNNKNDPYLGTLTFTPFLTILKPYVPPVPTTILTPTLAPTMSLSTSTATLPSRQLITSPPQIPTTPPTIIQPIIYWAIVIILIIIVILFLVIIIWLMGKREKHRDTDRWKRTKKAA